MIETLILELALHALSFGVYKPSYKNEVISQIEHHFVAFNFQMKVLDSI